MVERNSRQAVFSSWIIILANLRVEENTEKQSKFLVGWVNVDYLFILDWIPAVTSLNLQLQAKSVIILAAKTWLISNKVLSILEPSRAFKQASKYY